VNQGAELNFVGRVIFIALSKLARALSLVLLVCAPTLPIFGPYGDVLAQTEKWDPIVTPIQITLKFK
jgi:ABC-type transport system involved in cytochrome bd biosynthesis fused ATPase/permease subunit